MKREFVEEEVSISSDNHALAAAWRRPTDDEAFPSALLIAGSGPTDRDGDIKKAKLSMSRYLADLLAANGWGSLRYDKRGVGGSTGDYLSTGLWDEYSDANAAYTWMRAQPAVGSAIAIGHSMGASFAAELSASHESLDGIVLLAGIAKLGEEALLWQTGQMKDHLLSKPMSLLMRLFRTDLVKQQEKAIARIKSTDRDVVRMGLAKTNAKWLREMLAYDPVPALRATAVPTLAITGEKDVQVDAKDLEVVAEAIPTADVIALPDVDHLLRYEPEAISSPRRYMRQMAKPVDERVTAAIVNWLQLTFD